MVRGRVVAVGVALLAVAALGVFLAVRKVPADAKSGEGVGCEQGPASTFSTLSVKTPGVSASANIQTATQDGSPKGTAETLSQSRPGDSARAARVPFSEVSGLMRPKPFDRKVFEADPVAYCAIVEPSRAFMTAQPGREVPQLEADGPVILSLPHQGSVDLRVKAVAGAPTTFYATDLAKFSNGQTSITVLADKDGYATARYTAMPGTIDDSHVTAGCPMTSGRVIWVIDVASDPDASPVAAANPDKP